MPTTVRGEDDFVKTYVRVSLTRMIIGSALCFGIMGLAFFVSFPTCARFDTVVSVRPSANKYYLTFQGESGIFGMWSDKSASPGDRICVRPSFAQ